jgi:PAS domain S-box-containing protein
MEPTVTRGLPTASEAEQLRARLAELEQTAARRGRELVALHEISLEIGQLSDLTTLLQTTVEKAASLLNAQMGGLYLVHPENGTLELVVAHNLPGMFTGTILKLGEGLSGRIAQTGQVMMVPDYQAWAGQAAVFAGAPFRRVVGVPLKIGEKVIGVINITDDQRTGDFDEDEVRLVTLFAEQAAIAIEKARLLAEVQRDLAERQRTEQIYSSLYRITEAIHTAQNLDELYRSIHNIIAALMPARNFAIALYDAATESFIFPYRVDEHYPDELTPPPRPLGKTLVDYVWQTGTPLLATMEQLERLVAEQHLQPLGVMALDWLGVPLKWQDKTIGVMVVQTYTMGERLTPEHQQLLMFVSTQVALAIQRKRAEQRQQSIYRISEAAYLARDLDDLYRLLHQIVNELMPARNFGIALYDAATDMIRFPYFVDEDYQMAAPPPRRRGNGMIEYVLRTGQPLLGTQAELNALIEREHLQPVGNPAQSWLGVPLKVQDRSIGVIVVQTYQPGELLTEEHKQVLSFVSTQVVTAIERKRAEQMQQAIYHISEAAQAAGSLDELYRAIHAIVNELMPARNFYIALYDETTDLITFPYLVDEYDDSSPVQRPGKGLTAYVLRTGQPLFATPEVFEDLLRRGEAELIGGASVDWLGVPLKVRDKVIGIIAVQSYSEHMRLTEEHRDLLSYVSTQVAVAIQRRQTAQVQASIYRIAEAAHTARSLGDLYHAIHQIVGELMPARSFYLALYDAVSDTVSFPYFVDEIEIGRYAPPRQHGHGLTEYVLRLGKPWLGTAARIQDLLDRGEIANIGPIAVTWLGVPLKVEGEIIGLVVVQSYSERTRLTEEHEAILQYVSAQVAMAIQRKRAEEALRESERRYHDLFEAAQRQAQELTLLDRVRTAVTRELNLAELFHTVVTALAETFGYTLVSSYLLDGQLLRLQHQVGYEIILDNIPITSGVMGRVTRTGRPELVEDVFADPAFLAAMDDIVSEIAVPLFDAGRTVGVLNIESTRGFRLTEADLRLMIALGEHVSSAISRARLYTEARQNAARLTAAVESLPFDFWAMDLDRRYVLQNSVSARHWGERIGKRVDQLDLPGPLRAHWESNDRRAFAGEVVQGEVTYELDGEQRHFHEIIAPIWSEGEIQGVIGVNIDITDRQRAEAALRASEARLRAVTANIPVILFALDRDGLFTFVEGRGLEALDIPAENLVGRSVFEIARDLPRIAAAMQLALAGEPLNVILELNQRAYEVWLSPLTSQQDELNGVIGVAVDMTERERTAQALRDSEERYRILFDSNPHPMWAYDLETLRFLAVNDAAIRHYGYSREEFLNMTIVDIRPVEDVPALLENVRQVTQGLDEAGVWRHRRKDGTLIEVEITSHTLVLDGRPAEVVLATDVTERRRTEEALRRAQKMESLGLLAGGIAHDFNNLLVAILGQTSLALTQLSADSPARAPIEKAVAASRRAADLTRQLLAYSGRGHFERRPIDLNRLIQENLHLFEVAVPKNVALRSDLVKPLPFIVGDAGQLQQVIMNMIINGAEAIGEKSGEVIVRTQVRRLTSEAAIAWQIGDEELPPGDYVLLVVEDNGQGMDAATLPRIFDPFFSTKFTGRGLGLAAVLGIVRGHGGGLKVISAPNVGTTFEVVLPGGTAEAVELVTHEAQQEVDMAQPLVLVIDDEEPVRDAVTDILDLDGLPVLTAPDGRTGIDLYRERETEVGLVLLDLSMPGLSGEETFYELRRINPHVRVLLSSGYSQAEVAVRFAGQSDVGFIQKPYDAEQLVREVKRYMSQPSTG